MNINRLFRRATCFAAVSLASATASTADFSCYEDQPQCLYDSIRVANENGEPDIIRFSAGGHLVGLSPFSDTCVPPIKESLTIIGAGVAVTYLETGGRACRHFYVEMGAELTLVDLTVNNGLLIGEVGQNAVLRGASIYNEGRLNLERSAIRNGTIAENNNYLSGGGGVYNAPGAFASLKDTSLFYNNVEENSYGGGAVLNEGTMTIERSRFFQNEGNEGGVIVNGLPETQAEAGLSVIDTTIEDNIDGRGIWNGSVSHSKLTVRRTSILGHHAVTGGGIHNNGEATISESTIAYNQAARGGGIYSGKDAFTKLINTTISTNSAVDNNQGLGGGIFNDDGAVYIVSSTLSLNTSDSFGAIIAMTGAGANGPSDPTGTHLKSTLIMGYPLLEYEAQGCYTTGPNPRPLISHGNNMHSQETNCWLEITGDRIANDSAAFTDVIGPLANNGGPTQTHALLRDSWALDNTGEVCTDFDGQPISIDQRGVPRTDCDVGAYDFNSGEPLIEAELLLPGNQQGVRPRANGNITIAILSSSTMGQQFLPADDVDIATLALGPASASPASASSQLVNSDTSSDLVLKFKTRETGVACGDTQLELRGVTNSGWAFAIAVPINTVGCTCD